MTKKIKILLFTIFCIGTLLLIFRVYLHKENEIILTQYVGFERMAAISENEILLTINSYSKEPSRTRVFIYKNNSIAPLKINESYVYDFFQDSKGVLYYLMSKSGSYVIYKGDKPIFETKSRPYIFGTESLSILYDDTLHIFNDQTTSIPLGLNNLIYDKIPDLKNYTKPHVAAFYDDKLFLNYNLGEWGGRLLIKDMRTNEWSIHYKGNIRAFNITNNKLFALENYFSFKYGGSAIMAWENDNFNTILEYERSGYPQEKENNDKLSSFHAIKYYDKNNCYIIAMSEGIITLDDKFNLQKIITYNFESYVLKNSSPTKWYLSNPPVNMLIGNANLIIGTDRGGIYRFDLSTLRYIDKFIPYEKDYLYAFKN